MVENRGYFRTHKVSGKFLRGFLRSIKSHLVKLSSPFESLFMVSELRLNNQGCGWYLRFKLVEQAAE